MAVWLFVLKIAFCSAGGRLASIRRAQMQTQRVWLILLVLLVGVGLAVTAQDDTTPPVSSHTLTPSPNSAGWNNTDPVTVNITATDDGGAGVASIHYILDGGSEVSVAGSSASVSVSGKGAHTVEYWAVDDAGNVETPPNTTTVKIDTTSPDVVETKCYTDSSEGTEIPYGMWTNDRTLYFEWTDPKSPSGDTFYYELNHSSGNTIGFNEIHTTTVNYVEITLRLPSELNNWWFHVAAKNGAGIEGPQGKPRKILIKYDGTKPTVHITTPSDAAVIEGTATINADITEDHPGTISVKIDGSEATTNLPYSWDTTTVSDGSHTITVEETDKAGNTGSDSVTVTVNNVPPSVTCPGDQTADEGTPLAGLQVTFTDPGADTHTATVDWGDGTTDNLGTVTNPFSLPNHVYSGSFAGPFHIYTVTVTVTDDDGDTGTDNFDVTVTDVGAPTTTLNATPPNPDNNPSPYFEWTGTDDHSLSASLVYSYRVDKGSWSGWSAKGANYVTLTGLREGTHTFEVRAMDEAGNIGNTASYTWVLDLTGPEIAITVPEDGAAYALNDTVNSDWIAVDALSGLDTASAVDDVNTGMASGAPFYTGSVGLHEFTVTATDLAGNTTTKTITYRVVYTILPGGAAGGGGAAGEGKGTPGFLDKSIAGGGGAVGITTLEAVYTVGDIIHARFSLTDADGNNIPDAVVSCTLVKVTLGEEEAYEVLNLWRFGYNADTELYYLDIPTEGLAPGIYDLWLGFDDGTQKRLRIQLEGG